jgi:hypothetical protein
MATENPLKSVIFRIFLVFISHFGDISPVKRKASLSLSLFFEFF